MSDDRSWDVDDSSSLYRFADWSEGYFGVSECGNVQVYTTPRVPDGIDIHEIVEGLASRELSTPLLLRFAGVLEHRLRQFRSVFDEVIAEAEYNGNYTLCYPIKVNQQRHVCEEIRDVSRDLGFGLEVGSKPELLAALGLTGGDAEMPILCNGFKDREYIELVVLAGKLGRNIVPIVERYEELELIVSLAKEHGHWPKIGIRVRLSAAGAGRWTDSSGSRGKFGLSALDLLRAVDRLREEGKLEALHLLHCHVGSQIQDIAAIKRAVMELAHVYVELHRQGAYITQLDLGGGLGVDYDGTRSAGDASVNYGLPEYVSDVVYRVKEVCDDAGVPHPNLVTESGRAAVAYGSVLVVDVLGTRVLGADDPTATAKWTAAPDDGTRAARPLRDLQGALSDLEAGESVLAAFHDATHARYEAEELFSLGHMTLAERAQCEELFWVAARRTLAADVEGEELSQLAEQMADQYYCNFSLFQSLPDTWAIDQLFPIAPIHRLAERPDRTAILGDITCDSDGRVTQFLVKDGLSNTLPLHSLVAKGDSHEPYYLGIFLVGAYQETLGDLHNLLGDTHAVHINTGEGGTWEIAEVVEGDTTREVLGYVQYDVEALKRTLGRDIEQAIRNHTLDVPEANRLRRALERGLQGYTYLNET